MAISNFLPEIWSARTLFAFRNAHVFGMLTNRNYEGEIRNAGDVVRINSPAAITVNTYSGSVTYQTPTSTQQSLSIDQKKYWAFAIDDADQAQANVDLVDAYTQEGGYAMADAVDAYIASLYSAAGHTTALDISTDSTGVRDALIEAGQNLDESNVPTRDRWLVVSPTVMSGIRKATDYTPASAMGDEMKRAGSLGFIEGFNVYVSNNVAVATQHKCLYGTNAAITLATQLVQTEALRLESQFGDGIRQLMVYGAKVVRSTGLGVLNTTV